MYSLLWFKVDVLEIHLRCSLDGFVQLMNLFESKFSLNSLFLGQPIWNLASALNRDETVFADVRATGGQPYSWRSFHVILEVKEL